MPDGLLDSRSTRLALGAIVRRPLSASGAIATGFAILLVGAAYCVALVFMLRGAPSVPFAAAWAAVSVLPWYGAFEINKRVLCVAGLSHRAKAVRVVAVLAATLLIQAALEMLLYVWVGRAFHPLGLHLVDHMPETVIVGLATVIASLLASRAEAAADPAEDTDLPVAPTVIDWVKAAGNYLEIGTAGRVLMHRMTMARAEQLLEADGFVRINRSLIVPRRRIAAIARARQGDVAVLADGSRHRVGSAFRNRLASS